METATKLELDGMTINPETGEVYDVMDCDLEYIKTRQLPWIARQMQTLLGRIKMVTQYQDDEVARIVVLCDAKTEPMRARLAELERQAQALYDETIDPVRGVKKIEYPGLGTFSTTKGREYVDDTAYRAMSDDQRADVHKFHKDLFAVKTTVSPKKKEIRATINDGAVISGFVVERGPDRFTFNPDGV